jgi:hypothetical protein
VNEKYTFQYFKTLGLDKSRFESPAEDWVSWHKHPLGMEMRGPRTIHPAHGDEEKNPYVPAGDQTLAVDSVARHLTDWANMAAGSNGHLSKFKVREF